MNMLPKEKILKSLFRIQLFFFITLCCFPQVAFAQSEYIESYDVELEVHSSGKLTVVENITVYANGNNIKRGIYREFPTHYYDDSGRHYSVAFHVLEVKRDGKPEPYHIKNQVNGKSVYIGDKDIFLKPGLYSYTIAFETDYQLGFFEDFDELYFNAIGHGWRFPIKRGSVVVTLPAGISKEKINVDGFTGPTGSHMRDFQVVRKEDSLVHYVLTESLNNYEGFTVLISWPKGFVTEPTEVDRAIRFVMDNLDFVFGGCGLLFLFFYFLTSWSRVGRDPKKGTIIPRFDAPNGITPAGARYLQDMRYSTRSLTATIYALALKGALLLREDSGDYYIRRVDGKKEELTTIEEEILNTLLPFGSDEQKITQKDYRIFQKASKRLKKYLKKKHLKRSFFLNSAYISVGFFLALLIAIVMFLGAFLSSKDFANPIFIGIFAFTLSMPMIFSFLMKAPSKVGRKIMDEIEGYKMYLSTAEKDRLGSLAPTQITPELYEKHLPYAISLGVEQKWTKQFEEELKRAGKDPSEYEPHWYHGTRSWNDRSMFGGSLGDTISSTIASSSSPPGSSSGGSGGSSGGGGGGGGGGGW